MSLLRLQSSRLAKSHLGAVLASLVRLESLTYLHHTRLMSLDVPPAAGM